MNAEELAANPRLSRWFVQNFNRDPTLLLADDSIDAAMICVSIQYLERPAELLREVARVLRPKAPGCHRFFEPLLLDQVGRGLASRSTTMATPSSSSITCATPASPTSCDPSPRLMGRGSERPDDRGGRPRACRVIWRHATAWPGRSVMELGTLLPWSDIGGDPTVIREYAQAAEAVGYDFVEAPDQRARRQCREPAGLGPQRHQRFVPRPVRIAHPAFSPAARRSSASRRVC